MNRRLPAVKRPLSPQWIAFVVLLLILVLTLQAPAWLLDQLLGGRLRIVDASGSLWNGQGWLAVPPSGQYPTSTSGEPAVVMPISWRLIWSDALAIGFSSLDEIGKVRFGLENIDIELPRFRFPLERLPVPAPLDIIGVSGQATLAPARLDCDYRGNCRGQLKLSIEGLSLRMFPGERLGNAEAEAMLHPPALEASLRMTGSGVLQGEIDVSIIGKAMPTIKGRLLGTEGASPQLKAALATLGRSGPEGVTLQPR